MCCLHTAMSEVEKPKVLSLILQMAVWLRRAGEKKLFLIMEEQEGIYAIVLSNSVFIFRLHHIASQNMKPFTIRKTNKPNNNKTPHHASWHFNSLLLCSCYTLLNQWSSETRDFVFYLSFCFHVKACQRCPADMIYGRHLRFLPCSQNKEESGS